jgi:protein-S-isoprenylcysteine O-methyltransferase Ste14
MAGNVMNNMKKVLSRFLQVVLQVMLFAVLLFVSAGKIEWLWAWIPSAIMAILFIIRTALEDKTLQNELEGYKEYAQKVQYRLMPGIW